MAEQFELECGTGGSLKSEVWLRAKSVCKVAFTEIRLNAVCLFELGGGARNEGQRRRRRRDIVPQQQQQDHYK